ncbi:MAG: hypothetical protein J0M24_14025 [Verrucomicrobia bacterium]|nr:hypothetical protein [Verrucomicrobiota bacterium]
MHQGTSAWIRRRTQRSHPLWAGIAWGVWWMATLLLQAAPQLPTGYSLRRWAATPELNLTAVEGITQTRDGFLWLAMNHGLGRFDGNNLEVFHPGNTPGFPTGFVTSVLPARDDSLWVGTAGGGLIRHHQGRFTTFGGNEGLTNGQVKSLALDQHDRLWIATDGGGVFVRHPEGRFQFFGTNDGLPGLHTSTVLLDEQDRPVVLAKRESAWRLEGDRFVPLTIQPPPPKEASLIITRGFDGHIWLGGSHGIYRLQGREFLPWAPAQELKGEKALAAWQVASNEFWLGTDQSMIHWKDGRWAAYPTRSAISARTAGGFWIDQEHSVWFGTEGGGLIQLRPTPAFTWGIEEGLAGNEVTSVLSAQDGSLWVGTTLGLHRIDDSANRQFSAADGLPDHFVYAVQQDTTGTIWVSTRRGGLTRWDGRRFQPVPLSDSSEPIIWCLAPGAQGSIWAGTTDGAYQIRKGSVVRIVRDGLSNNDVRSIWDDGTGIVWIGTSFGLNRLDATGLTSFTSLGNLPQLEVGISLHQDRRGDLWIGTMSQGLYRYRKDGFSHLSVSNGLPSATIYSIIEDGEANLWIGTARGLLRLTPEERDAAAGGQKISPLVLGRSDGLRNEEFNGTVQPTAARDASGQLWFATAEGVASLHPNRIPKNDRNPLVRIEQLALEAPKKLESLPARHAENDVEMLLTPTRELGSTPAPAGQRRTVFSPEGVKTVLIPPGLERLDFQFVCPTFISPQDLEFRYLLEGFDNWWVEAGKRNAAYYTRVPPGRYTLRVQARTEDGIVSEPGASLEVIVTPFWWQRTEVRVLGAVLVLGCIGLLYQIRVRQLQRESDLAEEFSRQLLRSQEQERARLAGELHDGLGQELQLIRNRAELALRRHTPPADLAKELDSISLTASRAINGVRALSRGLRPPELDQLGLTQALRWLGQNVAEAYGGTLETRIDNVDKLLPQPAEVDFYRIAQEALTNSLKHSGATEITYEVDRQGDRIQLSVFDNGRGLKRDPESEAAGSGMKTMRERAAMLHGDLEVRSELGKGTRLTLKVPVVNSEAVNA